MKRLLLDTCAFLWFITGDSRLSLLAKELILDENNERLLSIASAWEMAIKYKLGKLTLPDPLDVVLDDQLRVNKITLLPIDAVHVIYVSRMAMHHNDPFDRIILSQSIVEGLYLLSADTKFTLYGANLRW